MDIVCCVVTMRQVSCGPRAYDIRAKNKRTLLHYLFQSRDVGLRTLLNEQQTQVFNEGVSILRCKLDGKLQKAHGILHVTAPQSYPCTLAPNLSRLGHLSSLLLDSSIFYTHTHTHTQRERERERERREREREERRAENLLQSLFEYIQLAGFVTCRS